MDQKNTENFQKQIEQNTMKTYLNRLQNNDAIFDEVRYPTGFPELDKALSGGLVAGLHCIGAISSLGKTTFVLQMAENMASTGIPVIILIKEHGNQFSKITLQIRKGSSKQSNMIFEIARFDSDLSLYCFIIFIASFLNIFKFCCTFLFSTRQ